MTTGENMTTTHGPGRPPRCNKPSTNRYEIRLMPSERSAWDLAARQLSRERDQVIETSDYVREAVAEKRARDERRRAGS